MKSVLIKPKFWPMYIRKLSIVFLIFLVSLVLVILTIVEPTVSEYSEVTKFLTIFTGVLFLISLVYIKIKCETNKLYFEGDQLVHEWGIIRKNRQSIPSKRITDIFLTTGILDSLLGTTTISISTAGQDGYLISMASIGKQEAEELQNDIRKYINEDTLRRE